MLHLHLDLSRAEQERDAAWMSVGIIAASICVYIGLVGDPIFHQLNQG